MLLIAIQTRREIFGMDVFRIQFLSSHMLGKWLMNPSNYQLIERIVSIEEIPQVGSEPIIQDDFKRGTPGHPDNDMGM